MEGINIMNHSTKKYIIDNGNVFEGTLEQFQNRFFNDTDDQIERPDDIIVIFQGEYEDKMAIAVYTRSELEKFTKKFPDEFKDREGVMFSDECYSTEYFSLNSYGTNITTPNKNTLRYKIYQVTMNLQGKMYKMVKLPFTVNNSLFANKSIAYKSEDNDLYDIYIWASSDGSAIQKAKVVISKILPII